MSTNNPYSQAVQWLDTTTDQLLSQIGGQVTTDNIDQLTIHQHCLLAYRYLRDEVMQGGFIQLIQNGYGPYVLLGPFPMLLKQQLGMKDFGQFLFDVAREYKRNREALEADKIDEEFMAQYETFDTLNNYGDHYLDHYEETITPQIVSTLRPLIQPTHEKENQ